MAIGTQMNRTRSGVLFVRLAVPVGLAGLISCSSNEAPGGERVEPSAPSPPAPPASSYPAPPSAEPQVEPTPSEHPSSLSNVEEPSSGNTRSPGDKAIPEGGPSRPGAKKVPNHGCTNDGQCGGDEFCDRGRCAAIQSARLSYGQRCDRNDNRQCGNLPCIDGRCRSCVSDKECEWAHHIQGPKCKPDVSVPGGRECMGVIPSIMPEVVPGPLPQRPGQ